MSALELLDRIAQKGLLEDRMIAKIRDQLRESSKPVSAESLAKLLVKKGQLTAPQAKQILDALVAAPPPLPGDHYDDLGLAPDETDPQPFEDDEVVEPVMDVPPIAPEDDIVGPVVTSPEPGPPKADVAGDAAATGVDEDHPMMDDLPEESSGRTISRKRSFMSELMTSLRGGPTQRKKKYTANRWDSPLMLVGGGALLVLIAIGVALYFFLERGTGDDAFSVAIDSYRQQAYDKSIGQFEQFLASYPGHPKQSSAIVRIGMARIWQQVEGQQWDSSLEAVREELPRILGEDAFGEARPELATLLPEIMEGFADRALDAESIPQVEESLDLANQTFVEVNNSAYLPTSVRRGQQPRIEQIQDKLESVKRRINRDRELDRAIAQIQELSADGQIAAAYDARRQLLRAYPSVELDERLIEAVRGVAETERVAVQPLTELPQPTTEPRPDASLFRVVLADRRGQSIPSLDGQVVMVNTNGSVFGLQASDGKLLWRFPIGYGSTSPPLSLSPIGEDDVVVVSQLDNELVRLAARTGDVVWRLPCPGKLMMPELSSGKLVVASTVADQGWILRVDPNTGQTESGIALPVPISTAPVIDVDRNRLIQPAAYATVYVLDLESLSCLGVTYLGHGHDTIAVPPVMTGGAVLIAENPGTDFSLVHVLVYDDAQPNRLTSLIDPIRVEGQAVTPLQSRERRVMLATDRGQIRVFELDMNQPSAPLRVIAEAMGTVQAGTRSYLLLDRGRLWVGDNQLTRYELQSSRGQLVRKWINSKGDLFLAPLQLRGDTLFHIRKRSGKTGATVAAVAAGNGDRREGEPIWETDLAVPPAGEPFVDRTEKEINVVTGNATLFSVGGAAIRAGVDETPRHRLVDPDLFPLSDVIELKDGRHVYVSDAGSDRIVVLSGRGGEARLKLVNLDVGAEQSVSTVPAAFRGGLIVATRSGTVDVFDVATGQSAMAPFQPPIKSGTSTQWLRPVTFDQNRQALLTDTRGQIFHLTADKEPQLHLTAIRQQQTDAGLIAPPIVIGDTFTAPVRGSDSDVIRRFALSDLQLQEQIELPGRLMWGPHVVNGWGLLMTDQGRLVGFDDKRQRFVTDPLEGPAIGRPVPYQEGVVIATLNGSLLHLDGITGEIQTRVQVKELLGTGPTRFSENRFIVCAGDGTLHVIALE